LIGGAIGGWGFGLAMKSVQSAAGKVSEKIDEKLQEQFDRITKRNGIDMAKKIVINILMGLGPILILLIAHGLF